MPISPDVIGRELPAATIEIERGRVRLFASAIGETDPMYLNLAAAQEAGHPDLPVPPTFLFSVDLEAHDSIAMLTELGVDLRRVLHGEQSFTYYRPVYAGESLTVRPRISDVYTKKGGALEFLVKQTTFSRADGAVVADITSTLVVQNPEAGR